MINNKLLHHKVLTADSLDAVLQKWKSDQEVIVFTNGCFDILHLGHVDYLSKAADLGTKLIVGLNSDESVKRQNKSVSRPIQDEKCRAGILASLFFVDAVVVFNEDTPYKLIESVKPDILVKGADYQPEQIVGHDIVKAKGGKVITIAFLEGYSTSGIEKKIIDSHNKK